MTTEKKIFLGTGIATLLLIIGGVFIFSRLSDSSVPADEVIARNGLHWHPKVSIVIDEEKQQIDNGIGLSNGAHNEIHTHAEDYKEGVIHMEMNGIVTKDETKLGNFFALWGKDFSSSKIFDKTNKSDGKVTMLVNGKVNTNFENYLMRDKDVIEIKYE